MLSSATFAGIVTGEAQTERTQMNVLFSAEVPTDALPEVRERVAKLAKRAARKGFPVPVLTTGAVSIRKYHDASRQDQPPTEVEYTAATISGEPLRIGPWTLVASVDSLDGVPFFRPVPGEAVPVEMRDRNPNDCDHCHAFRNRSETFVVRHTDGTAKLVGRQCIRDFLGHDPASLLSYYNDLSDGIPSMSDIDSWGASAKPVFRPADIIEMASRRVAKDGYYLSVAKAVEQDRTSTGTLVRTMLMPSRKELEAMRAEGLDKPTEASTALYVATLTALNEPLPDNDWTYNVLTAFKAEHVTMRQVGVLASATILGMRKLDQYAQAKREAVAPKASSQHIGTLGAKVSVDATVTFMREFDSAYGVSTLVKLTTDDGNDLQWWASNPGDLAVDAKVTIRGTIKALDIDRFTKQPVTVLTRCKTSAR